MHRHDKSVFICMFHLPPESTICLNITIDNTTGDIANSTMVSTDRVKKTILRVIVHNISATFSLTYNRKTKIILLY